MLTKFTESLFENVCWLLVADLIY